MINVACSAYLTMTIQKYYSSKQTIMKSLTFVEHYLSTKNLVDQTKISQWPHKL